MTSNNNELLITCTPEQLAAAKKEVKNLWDTYRMEYNPEDLETFARRRVVRDLYYGTLILPTLVQEGICTEYGASLMSSGVMSNRTKDLITELAQQLTILPPLITILGQ